MKLELSPRLSSRIVARQHDISYGRQGDATTRSWLQNKNRELSIVDMKSCEVFSLLFFFCSFTSHEFISKVERARQFINKLITNLSTI